MDIDRDEFRSVGSVADKIVSGIAQERKWDGNPIKQAGVYAGVPIETYHHDTTLFGGEWSISSSGLRTLIRRPSEYWYTSPFNPNREEPETNKALDFGKAAHMLLLGERGFAESYALRPETYPSNMGDKPWSGNATWCKEWLAEQAKAGRAVITDTEIGHIRKIADALSKNEIVRLGLLNGRIERSLFTKDEKTGIWLRTRPDAIPRSSGDFADLKTAASVDDESLSKAIFNNGYHVQAGLLRRVARAVLGPDAFQSFTFVFVEKAAPYDVRVKVLKDADIDIGERQVEAGLKVMRRCIDEARWPGYDGFGDAAGFIEMPGWSRTRIENQLNYGEAA